MDDYKNLERRINALERKTEEKRIGPIRIHKGAIAGVLISVSFGIARIVLDRGEVGLPWVWQGLMGSENMEFLDFLLTWTNPDFLFIVPIMLFAGWILKEFTKVSNELIAFILLLTVGIPICGISGFFVSQATGWQRVFETVVKYGISQGVLITALTVVLYDISHGISKYSKDKKVEEGK